MNFLQFVKSIRQGASAEAVASSHTPGIATENMGVYMEHKVSLTSELAFFDFESIPPTLFITVNGKEYEAFFSVSELAGLIPEYADFLGTAANPLTVAEAILDYHKYDA